MSTETGAMSLAQHPNQYGLSRRASPLRGAVFFSVRCLPGVIGRYGLDFQQAQHIGHGVHGLAGASAVLIFLHGENQVGLGLSGQTRISGVGAETAFAVAAVAAFFDEKLWWLRWPGFRALRWLGGVVGTEVADLGLAEGLG